MTVTLGSLLKKTPKYGINAAATTYTSSLPAYIRITDIDNDGRFLPDPLVSVDSPLSQNYILQDGDIVIARTGASVGKSYRYRESNGELVFAGFLICITPDEKKLDPVFAGYYLQSKPYWDWIAAESVRSGQPGINAQQLMRLELDLPDIQHQREIGSRLSDVDSLISSLERLISKKQAIKQGMMQELLTGRTRLPGFNRPWHEKLLGDLTRIKTGSRNNQDKVSSGAYPFFVRSQTVERIDTYSYSGEAVLIPGEGGIGEIFHYINGCHEVHQRVYRISDFSGISGKFAFYYLQQFFKDHALRNTVKATVDSIRLPIIQSFKMTIPSTIDEQTAIAAILDDTSSEIDALERRLESARNIKQGMMQELLSGRTRLPIEEVSS